MADEQQEQVTLRNDETGDTVHTSDPDEMQRLGTQGYRRVEEHEKTEDDK